jgi:predicted RecA/RadA family phage recombinase
MANNEIYIKADSLVFPVASTVKSGDLVQVGQVIGVAEVDAKAGDNGSYYATLRRTGVFEFSTLVTTTVGANMYVTSAGVVTTTATSNKFIGHALKAKTTSTAGYVPVILVQSAA